MIDKAKAVMAARAIAVLSGAMLLFFGFGAFSLPISLTTGIVIAGTVVTVVTLLAILALLKADGLAHSEVGLCPGKRWLRQFVLSTLAGAALCCVMYAVAILLSPLEVSVAQWDSLILTLLIPVPLILLLAVMEEVVFRSYALFQLRKATGVRTAIYTTSVFFAFYHGLSPDNLLGPGVWGLFYGWLALKTGNIVWATGFHFGLNWAQAWFGVKQKYGPGVLEFGNSGQGILAAESVGVAMQLVLLVIGIGLVESLARRPDPGAP